jgi:glycosyltransferase involved in cell wall biosynthesis
MKLSIITINLNNREGLRKTIESVVTQTFNDYEWIVIDGGSTDGSTELIKQYASHLAYWVSEPDKGVYNAMNKGIRQAKGEWLQFLNSGDLLYEKTTLQKIFDREYGPDVLYGNAKNVHKDGSISDYIAPDNVSYAYIYRKAINHVASFFKRELFLDSLYNENFRIVSDWEYCLNLVLRGCRFEHINHFVVWYDNTGLSSRMLEVCYQEGLAVKEKCPPHLMVDVEWINHFYQVYYNGKFCTALTRFFLLIVSYVSRWRNRIVAWRIRIKK